jgi:putative endonuclease
LAQSSKIPVAGFIPAIHVFVPAAPTFQTWMPGIKPGTGLFVADWKRTTHNLRMAGWFYMMTNRKNGTLHGGSAVDLARRAWEHREGVVDGFTKSYGLKRLIYFERYDDIREARRREEAIKHWPRAWKVRLVQSMNPDWADLYDRLL